MDFSGKKTERVLMRVPPGMKEEVEAMSKLEHRPIQDQYRFLIAYALNQLRMNQSNGIAIPKRQPTSTRTFAEQMAKRQMATAVNFEAKRDPTHNSEHEAEGRWLAVPKKRSNRL